eukprot:55791-Chlamydomonas_euryale.AAC.1
MSPPPLLVRCSACELRHLARADCNRLPADCWQPQPPNGENLHQVWPPPPPLVLVPLQHPHNCTTRVPLATIVTGEAGDPGLGERQGCRGRGSEGGAACESASPCKSISTHTEVAPSQGQMQPRPALWVAPSQGQMQPRLASVMPAATARAGTPIPRVKPCSLQDVGGWRERLAAPLLARHVGDT